MDQGVYSWEKSYCVLCNAILSIYIYICIYTGLSMHMALYSISKKRVLPSEASVLKFDFPTKKLFKRVQLDEVICLQNRRYLFDRGHIMLTPPTIKYENNEF